jgi:hypothetical protein
MKNRRIAVLVTAPLALGGIALGSLAMASGASAATANYPPRPVHHACAANLNGYNVLDLTFQGGTFTYPVFLRVADNGLISGVLVDKGLPAGSQVLRVHGLCNDDNVILDSNYPSVDPQGSRSEDMIITPTTYHHGTVAGVWDEAGGTENGSGAASLENPVHLYH